MGMSVDQTGDENVRCEVQARLGAEAGHCLVLRQDGENAAVLNGDGVVFENLAFRFDRNDPAGAEQGGDGLRQAGFSER